MSIHPLTLLLISICAVQLADYATCKSTIEPCENSNTCKSMLGYVLHDEYKISQVAALFEIHPIDLLTANAIDTSYPDVDHYILSRGVFLKIPVPCSCTNGIRKSIVKYQTQSPDTVEGIAGLFGHLVSTEQITDANGLSSGSVVLNDNRALNIPLPCFCFNSTDAALPATYLTHVVREADTVDSLAAKYRTTPSDIERVNILPSSSVQEEDILAIPLPACSSDFPKYASDSGLIVANQSYTLTANHCVQCSCGEPDLKIHCTRSPLSLYCPNTHCKYSNLTIGDKTYVRSNRGCWITSCDYYGFINGSVWSRLSYTMMDSCPEPPRVPPLIEPPSLVPLTISVSPSSSPASGPDPAQLRSRRRPGSGPGPVSRSAALIYNGSLLGSSCAFGESCSWSRGARMEPCIV